MLHCTSKVPFSASMVPLSCVTGVTPNFFKSSPGPHSFPGFFGRAWLSSTGDSQLSKYAQSNCNERDGTILSINSIRKRWIWISYIATDENSSRGSAEWHAPHLGPMFSFSCIFWEEIGKSWIRHWTTYLKLWPSDKVWNFVKIKSDGVIMLLHFHLLTHWQVMDTIVKCISARK